MNKGIKMPPWQIWLISGVLSLVAGLVVYFTMIKPSNEEYAAQKARFDAAEPDANALLASKNDIKKANAEVAKAKRDWGMYDQRFMPVINITDLYVGSQQLWQEQMFKLGPAVREFLMADKTVRVAQANLSLPAPSEDLNAVNQKLFVFPLGSVTVSGKFENILRHVERWNQFTRKGDKRGHGLIVADGLQLSGNSPSLTGQYTLTCYIFTQGDTPGAPIPQAGGAGGGMGGMGPGGMPMMGGMGPGGMPSMGSPMDGGMMGGAGGKGGGMAGAPTQ